MVSRFLLCAASWRTETAPKVSIEWQRLVCIAASSFAIWITFSESAAGESQLVWSEPKMLSAPCCRSDSPHIVADQIGQVFVVWASDIISGSENLDTVFITCLSGGRCSVPVDILAATPDDDLTIDEFVADPYGRLVIVWHTNSEILFSYADSNSACDAKAWSTGSIDTGSISDATVIADDHGTLHLSYVRGDTDLIYRHTIGSIAEWSQEQTVFKADREYIAISHPTLAFESEGRICSALEYHEFRDDWTLAGVIGINKTLEEDLWGPVDFIVSDDGYGIPHLFVDKAGLVHLTFVGNLAVGGRYHSLSTDSCQTWTEPRLIAGPDQIRGHSGAVHLIQDSVETLHAVYSGYSERDQIWYSTLGSDGWTAPESLSENLARSERSDAAIVFGSRIYTVWYDYGTEAVWAAEADLGTPLLPPEPLAVPLSQDRADVDAVSDVVFANRTDQIEKISRTEVLDHDSYGITSQTLASKPLTIAEQKEPIVPAYVVGMIPAALMVVLVVVGVVRSR